MQVNCRFDGNAESAAPACRSDSNHDHFVSWDTRWATSFHGEIASTRVEITAQRANGASAASSSLISWGPRCSVIQRNMLRKAIFRPSQHARSQQTTYTEVGYQALNIVVYQYISFSNPPVAANLGDPAPLAEARAAAADSASAVKALTPVAIGGPKLIRTVTKLGTIVDHRAIKAGGAQRISWQLLASDLAMRANMAHEQTPINYGKIDWKCSRQIMALTASNSAGEMTKFARQFAGARWRSARRPC